MSKELATVIAKKFIQNKTVKAVQMQNGAYIPDSSLRKPGDHAPLGWHGRHVLAHLEGQRTYGNYMLDENNLVKFFALDIDLRDPDDDDELGAWYELPDFSTLPDDMSDDEFAKHVVEHQCSPRQQWSDRRATQARNWFKWQMSQMAHRFCGVITRDLGLKCAAAYSGAKGIHVYGFMPKPTPAGEAREGALLALDIVNEYELLRGKSFYIHKEPGMMGFRNFTIEVYPKQDEVHNKNGLGNLLRLPLGRNLKSSDPTFFLDLKVPLAKLAPHANPIQLLESGDPYA